MPEASSVALIGKWQPTDDAPVQVRLLFDIRDAFGEQETIFTKTLLARLNELDESPWGARRKGEGLDARGLCKLLRPFKIRPRTVGSAAGSAKDYRFDQFADAFARYLPYPSQASHRSHHAERDATDATDATDTQGGSGPGCFEHFGDPRPGCRSCQSKAAAA